MTTRRLPLIEPETLPPRLARWAERLLEGPIPREEHATCAACAMVSDDENDEQVSFSPQTKCCTYLPELPNFSVGAILSGAHAGLAHDSVRRRIANRVSVTPLGVGQPPPSMDPRSRPPVFGRDVAFLCDHYSDGCSIWAHRESVCATYFCKLQRGAVGSRFWSALRAALAATERAVARGCVLRLGLPASAIAALRRLPVTPGVLPAAVMDSRTYRAIWASWGGREEAFFVECARVADHLSWEDVERWGGAELAVLAEAARHEHRALITPKLPQEPVCRAFMIRPAGPECTHVVGYSAIDPISLPPSVIAALRHFDGRPLADALASAREQERVAISEELVQTLSDFGVIEDRGA